MYVHLIRSNCKKLGKVPFLGILNEKRICNAMNRITKAVNTARSLRASIKFCLGAFRSNIEISTFTEAKQQSCFCCRILEKHNSINETGRNPIFHLLFDKYFSLWLKDQIQIEYHFPRYDPLEKEVCLNSLFPGLPVQNDGSQV